MYDICALGEVLIDAIASADTCIQITGNAGGAPANVLTCCGTRMGLKMACWSPNPNLRRNLWCDEQTAAKYIREGLALCNVAKLSDEERRFLYGDQDVPSLGRRMLRDYPNLRLLFVTCGGAGGYAFCGEQMQYVPGYPVKVADTTGVVIDGKIISGYRGLFGEVGR